ncbi:hypothetical protein BOTBODRAFT_71154 [Botryobasidium botryosum FD-172 SS1]|uniref:Uncharacterized protein n=1 Tax=Botryobasidium botryosum (strain FD-172 SS1) TaxID=930990 RepID=A0A067M2X5_BOTB1|nr:hypothetical protein BOTBODRAFT_71154 [Botryobasidium botryosum FD-172 SS1]
MGDDTSGPQISIAAGITVGLIASCVQSLGLTIQRKSHVLNQACAESERRVEHRRPLWLLGFAIFLTSNILGSIFQIASLPVVILAPLGAVSLLWNAFFARLLLGDFFSLFMVLGTLLIITGAVLIAVFGIVPEPTHSLEDLLVLFGRRAFIIYFTLLGVFLFIALAVTHIVEWTTWRQPIRLESPPQSPIPLPHSLPTVPSDLDHHPSERTPLVDVKPLIPPTHATTAPITASPRATVFMAISYASASGILSGMCLLFAKSGVELLVLTAAGQNQFWRWESWALVGGLVVFALLQLWYLHKSLILANPTLVCPLAFCCYNVSSIFNGLIYYDQLNVLSTKQLVLVIVGIVILLGGVWALSIQSMEVAEDTYAFDEAWPEEPAQGLGLEEHFARPSVEIPDHPNPWADVEHQGSQPTREDQFPSDLGIGRKSAPRRRVTSLPPNLPPIPSESPEPASPALLYHSGTMSSPGRPEDPSFSPPTSPRRRNRTMSILSPDPNVPGGVGVGFSIGLSPVSPGFALAPRRRRTRSVDLAGTPVGGVGSGGAPGGNQNYGGGDSASGAGSPSVSAGGAGAPPQQWTPRERLRWLTGTVMGRGAARGQGQDQDQGREQPRGDM